MLSIDEAIARYKEKANFYKQTTNIAYGLELEQIVEWLEELKALREEKSEFLILAKDNYEMGMENGYKKAIDDMVGNLIANSRTEIIDGKLMFIVTEERIKTVANEMKKQLDS